MHSANKLVIGLFCGLAIGLLGYIWVPVHITEEFNAPLESDALFEFGDTRTVSQSLALSKKRLVSLSIPIRITSPDAQGPLVLHIRKENRGDIIRTVSIPLHPGSELLTAYFAFSPISDTHSLVWTLSAPNDKDKTVAVYRELDDTIYPEIQAYMKNAELVGHFAYSATYAESRGIRGLLAWGDVLRTKTPKTLFVFSGLLIITLVLMYFQPHFATTKRIIVALACSSALIHIYLSTSLPVINDEGAYVQDALQSSASFIPLRDFLTKGPFYIFVLKMWSYVVPHSVGGFRFLHAASWAVAILLSDAILIRLSAKRLQRVITAHLLTFVPAVSVLSSYILLQGMSIPIVLLGMFLAIRGCQEDRVSFVMYSSGVMVLAYLTRASSAIAILITLFLCLMLSKRRIRMSGVYSLAGIGIATCFVGASIFFMGTEKTAVLFNAEALLVAQARDANVSAQHQEEPLIRTIISSARYSWYAAAPLLSGLFLAVFLLARTYKRVLWVPFFGVVISLLYVVHFHLADMAYLLPSHEKEVSPVLFMTLFGIPIVGALFLAFSSDRNVYSKNRLIPWISLVWLILLGGIYGTWGNFRQSYLLEFFLPAAWISGYAYYAFIATVVGQREVIGRLCVALGVLLYGVVSLEGFALSLEHPPTGTYSPRTVAALSKKIQEVVPFGESIFTAQSIFTAFGDRPVVLGYSHSGWYLYERLSMLPSNLRAIYFIEPHLVTNILRNDIKYVLKDRRTQEVYFDTYPEREEILKNLFTPIYEDASITDNPITLYARKTF